jgi:hypothetical protein
MNVGPRNGCCGECGDFVALVATHHGNAESSINPLQVCKSNQDLPFLSALARTKPAGCCRQRFINQKSPIDFKSRQLLSWSKSRRLAKPWKSASYACQDFLLRISLLFGPSFSARVSALRTRNIFPKATAAKDLAYEAKR